MSFITVLVDNTAQNPDLYQAEHGLSYWIEYEGHNILFDTGAGDALMPNMKTLGLDPLKIDAVVISHGHYDHIGGLAQILMARSAANRSTPVFISPNAFITHLSKKTAGMEDVGAPLESHAYIKMGAEFQFVEGQMRIFPGCMAICPIPRLTSFESPAPGLYTQLGGKFKADDMPDDLALVMRGAKGVSVVSGCAHSGVINLLRAAKKITGREPAYFVGGTHLEKVDEEQRIETLAELTRWSNLIIASGHCTGFDVAVRLAQALGDERYIAMPAGERIQV
jgi:7,8-dihydropterin-6-yl-methyl-4-(beta-D-ribofuranosyl)aminobenzene 5'-phosphate synthase